MISHNLGSQANDPAQLYTFSKANYTEISFPVIDQQN